MIIVKDKKSCIGCYACFNICPTGCLSMECDNEGFWYPKIDDVKCIECNLCIKTCPVVNNTTSINEPYAYACLNRDESIRLKSSSGGIFTLIAEKILENNGIVFGAAFNDQFEVVHNYIQNKEDIDKFRGSKYLQSKIGDSYKQVKKYLDGGKRVLFTGTPCQIGGLKSFLGKPYDNLYCVDIICHGVPSPKVWQKYIAYREALAGSPAQRIAFRCKDQGWKRYSVMFLFKNDTEYQQTLDKDLYMNAFLKDICLRPSCYNCNFKTLNRLSDITLADFWGIENVLPEMDDDKGTSLIFINNSKGQSMFNSLKSQIIYKKVEINEAVKYNSAAFKSSACNPKRKGFFKELDKLAFDKLVQKYYSDSIFFKLKRKVRSLGKNALKMICQDRLTRIP